MFLVASRTPSSTCIGILRTGAPRVRDLQDPIAPLNQPPHCFVYIPAAHEFDPDRFLDERVGKYLVPNPFIFLPFNGGPRICLGQQVRSPLPSQLYSLALLSPCDSCLGYSLAVRVQRDVVLHDPPPAELLVDGARPDRAAARRPPARGLEASVWTQGGGAGLPEVALHAIRPGTYQSFSAKTMLMDVARCRAGCGSRCARSTMLLPEAVL